MRKINLLAVAAVVCSVIAPAARAAENLLPSAALLPEVRPSVSVSAERVRSENAWQRRWALSLGPLVASQALDAASSYGMRELNPLLASGDGSFGGKAVALKFGAVGALMGVEYLITRKYPRSAKFFTVVNWTTAGATTGLAIHNYRLPR